MKRFINFLMLMLALVIAPMTAQADKTAKTEPNVERYNVSDSNGLLAFGKSYYEVDGRPVGANGNYYSTEHPNWSMKGWPNADSNKHVTTYIHFPACSTNAKIQLTTTGAVTFVVKVYCMEDPNTVLSTKTVNISTGTDQWITVMDTKNFSQKAWYKFDIQCTSGAANVGEFKYWQFSNSLSEPAYTADYMSSPSVHLNGWHTTDPSVPSAGRYDWTYQEVMIPEGDDIVGTYCMSLGVLHGYMGIQKDSENDYPIIFSMWDNGSTDNDPNLPDYLRSGALDAGEGVTIARFGGEGTGAQAKFRTNRNWVPGKWVKFLCNARPEIVDVEVDDPDHPGQKKTITYSNTLTSAWVWADGIDTDWRYIATIRQSGANNYMDGWYSFLEDYNWPSGQWKRNAYYRRGGLHSMVTGKWYNANNVGFGHTDGGTTYGDRDDYGHGKTIVDGEEAFYLTSGGYHENVTDTENTLTLITDFENKIGAPISQTTLTTLLARVDQAIKKEQEKKIAEEFDNSREALAASGFTVVAVNSEATNEDKNGNLNRKEAAIDGNENTYWHTRWSGGNGNYSYPYTIDIQLSEEMQAKEIEQITFSQRSGDNYHGQTLKIYHSTDGKNWTAYSGTYTMENAMRTTVDLNTKITGKPYIRLEFVDGYGQYLVLHEIYFRTAVRDAYLNAQVQAILDKENRFDGYSTSDLAALNTAYADGHWTDAQTVRTALINLASTGTLLKYGEVNGTNAISSFKAYQLHNAFGLGDLIVKTTPAVAADNDVDVTDLNNNWQLLRSEKWNTYYLYNSGAQKYLAFNNGTATLTDKPTPVQVGTRSHNETVDDETVTVFDGFTFQFDPADANSFLTAPAASASVRGMNKVAPANTSAVTLGASNTNGAVWQLRDNYGVTPTAVSVNELLENVEENVQPWTRPQFGGTVWTWNKTTNKFEATGKESTATPDRENNHGPVYTFPAGVGTVTTAVNSNTDTSDQGGFRILGSGDNVTTSLGRWAGSIEVSTGAVATVEYSDQLKGTEPTSAATVWVDGTLNFKSSRTNFNMNDGNAQRWYIGENGKINTSFTQVTKSGDRTWNLQIIVADEPLLPGKVLVPQEFTREVMTWASDIYSNINSCTVYHKDSEGYYHEVETPQITHTATGLSVTYTAMVNADPEPTGTRDLTYNFVHAGQTWASEQHAGANVGSAYPEISTTLPWGVVAAKPEGTVKADDDAININVVLNADYPVKKFVSTYDANGVFMKMGVNAKKQYCYANNTTFASSDNYDENNEAYRWQFVGNPFVGYTIYNKAGGKLYTPNNNTNPTISTTGETKWNFQTSDADSKGFFLNIHGDNSKWINRNGGNGTMAFTNQWRDAGSTFYTFAIEQATVHFQNLNTKKWVSYNANAHASNVYNDVVILAQHEANEAQATEFTLTGSSAEGYKISCNANGTTKYVYAINKDDANSNVGFTNDANTATLWKIQQTYRDGNGVDYFNIIPTGGERSWNARGTVNGVATVGQWNAGTATGGNPGSLWRIVSTQTEDITVTYHVTYGGVEKQTINQQTKKGSFYPSISGVPYGLNYTVPSGIVSADAEVTVGTTLASNYPVAPAATVGELTDANYFVMDINSDSHAYIHADGNSVQAHSETPSTVADIVKYQWAFVGNPFDGYNIYNKVGGTSKTLGASYALENGNAAKWKIVSGTASSFRVSPASSSGTYVSLSGNALANSTTTNNATNLRAVQATTWEQNFTKEYRIAGVTERPADLFSDMTLWYKTSAISTGVDNVWMEYSLPIGNGLFGASLYGNVKKDMVTFVDKTLWKKPANNYGSYQYFGELYAESLEEESLMGYNDETAIRNYVRYLDLDAGKAGVSYEDKNGGKYTHEYFASNPDNAIAIRYTASNGATINRRFTLVSGQPGGVVSNTTYAENGGYFGGKMEIESFNARFKVVNTGSTGTVTTTNEGIEVRGANEVLVILAGGTDYDITSTTYVSHTDQLPTTIANRVNDAAGKSWETLYTTHKTDYDKYYTACQFNIGGENTMDTESLVKNYNGDRAGASDLMLEQLYFAYGRYLSISSSRGADIPNNLQGIWANKQDLPWHSDIHTNINVQMNYWPVETTNLSDMHVPFLNQMIYETDTNIHNGWTQMAKNSNQQRGWTLFTESNIYGSSSSFQTNYVIANAWYVTHLWQHYRYTLDEEFLRKAFPAMLSCSQFWMDRLKLVNGKYLAPNEWSPEQGPNQDGVAHAQQLVRELFDNTIAAVGELDAVTKGLITAQDWEDLQERRQNLDLGLDIETYGGAWGAERNGVSTGANILREWKESPYTTGEAGHRHHSHLMCLYPFSQFTEGANGYTPEQLYEAALNSLKLRGDASTGWSMGWKMNLWARALDGDHTHIIIKNALRHSTSYGTDQGRGGIYYNLFDSHAPFQIDGNFGATAGMAECILQSHTGVINLLPALPAVWDSGSMKGMKAVGNFTVDQQWTDKKLTKATITSHKGQKLIVKYKDVDLTTAKITKNGTEVTPVAVTGGYKIADVAANDVVIISFTDEPEEEEDVPEPSVTATYAPAVYPAQQEIVGEANLDVSVGSTKTTYTFSNEVLAVQFVKKNGTLKFNGSTAMNLKPGTELFTIKFGDGSTVVNASDMTLEGEVETEVLAANADAVKGAEHFAGKALKATFTHQYNGAKVTFKWKAILRDGSHYLRTDLTMTSDKDVQMNAIIPMQYDVDAAAAGSAPAVVGNTRGAVLMSDKIFAGLETPTAYNSVISNTTVPEKWSNYKAWTGESDFSWMPSELPSGITDLNSNYTPQTVVGSRGYLKFDTTGNQTITFTYTEGGHKLNIVGVDVLDTDGNIVDHDYHEGRTGDDHVQNTYTLNIPSVGYYQVRYFISLLAWSESYKSESISSKGNITYSGSVSVPTVLFDLAPAALASTRRKVLSANQIANNENITDTWDTSTNQFQDMDDAKVPARVVELGHDANDIYYREQDLNISVAGGTLTTTFTHKGGSNRLQIVGVDLVDAQGNVAVNDYHFGYTGNEKDANTYSFIVPAAGQYKLRYLVSKQGEALTSNGDIAINYEIIDYLHLPAPAEVSIQGLWSRQATLKASTGDNLTDKDVVWNVSSVVGLVNPDHKRRSFLAYSERERAVPWRPFPIYNSWYELNINRKDNETPTDNNMSAELCTNIVEAWKEKLYDQYNVGIKSFVWDDGWDQYGTWEHHANFPNGFMEAGQAAAAMNTGIGAWLGPVGGYGDSGTYRRNYWNAENRGGMALSNIKYYEVFKNAIVRLVETEPTRDHYDFNYFKFDGISGQFSSVGPDPGAKGNEDAEGIITCERYVRENVKEDVFFNTTVGTWASPFWFHFSDAIWRQENDYGTIGNNSSSRENWITYRDRLVYQNYIQRSPICPINTLMTHGFILHQREDGNFDGVSNDLNYQSVLNELRCAFACGSGMVELYADHRLMSSIRKDPNDANTAGALWSDLTDCLKWQEANKDVLPDAHWVGGNPWTGSKAEIYGWAAWNGEKATLTLRNGAPSQQTFTTTLRKALDIPASFTGTIQLTAAFADQLGSLATIAGIAEGSDINPDTQITFTLPASSVYVYNGIDSEIAPEPDKVYTYTIRNKQNGKYAYYDASTVNEGNTIVALTGEQANAGEFTLTPVNNREDYYIMSCNSKYVKALNFDDANYNIAFVDNESDATAMHVAYVTTAGNVDYYNIIPDGGSRSWNARNPINSITTVGQWDAGNNDGSLWQFTSTSTEEITLTYTFTTEGLNDATKSFTLHKGDFRPRSLTAAPYGVTVTSTLKTGGIMTANDTETVAYTIADDYPFNYSNDFNSAHWYNLKIGNNLNVGYTTTQSDYNYPTSGSTEPANFAFLGTPWGTKIICKEAGADYGVGGTMENNASLTSVAIADAVTYIFERNSGHNVFHLDGVENGYINTVSWQSRLGNWINGAAKTDGNSTFQFIATEVDPSELCAELQEKINAIYDFFTGVIGQVGYPAYDSETAETLAAYADIFEGEVTEDNYAQALEAYNALLNETNITLPENGKAYKLMAVHVEEDGSIKNAYTIYSTADGQITGKNEEADGEIGDEGYTRFIARQVGEGNEFILVNELGRYLCWFDTDNDTKSFDTKGATVAYDGTYSIITLEHATTDATNNESGVKALTAEQRFGLFQMKAHPKNANTQYQYFCYNDGNSHRFVSGDPGHKYYNADGRHTFLFQLVEDESYTYNKPTLIKGNDDHYYASIYLPYPMQVPPSVECYRGTEDRGGSLALEQMNEDNAPVPAGGYILYSEEVFTDSDEYSETFGEVLEKVSQLVIPATANPDAVDNLFIGTTANGDAGKLWEAELEGNNPYVLANKSKGIGFYRYVGTTYPKGKAVYLAGSASTRECIGFQFDDIVEAIKTAKAEQDNNVFDLTGRRLEKAAKGVNIVSGKKVLK